MEFLISEKCLRCGYKYSGMQDVFFIYEYHRCINCYEETAGKKKASERYKHVQELLLTKDIPEDFYEFINYVIRNV